MNLMQIKVNEAIKIASQNDGHVYMMTLKEITRDTTVSELYEAHMICQEIMFEPGNPSGKDAEPLYEIVEPVDETPAPVEQTAEPVEETPEEEPAEAPKKKPSCIREKTPQKTIDMIIALYRAGYKQCDIAKKTGKSTSYVSSQISKWKDTQPLTKTYDAEFERDVLHLYEIGNTPEAIAKAKNCEVVAVTTYLKRNGIHV